MYRRTSAFAFNASHTLHDAPPAHPCGTRQHGHNYTVTIAMEAEQQIDLDPATTAGVAAFGAYVGGTLHARDLSAIMRDPATCEGIAHHLFHVARGLGLSPASVAVTDNAGTTGEYRS